MSHLPYKNKKISKGFTLIELLVVIGILAILLAITLIAINPQRQFSQSNDTTRNSNVNSILNAVNQFMADNKGTLPGGGIINATVKTIQSTDFNTFCTDLVPTYIAALPVDPLTNNGDPIQEAECSSTTAWNTNYTIQQISGSNRLTIGAPAAEIQATIEVTR